MSISVFDLTAAIVVSDGAPAPAEAARDRMQAAIVCLVAARHALVAVDPRAAAELDRFVVRLLLGGQGCA